MSTQHLAGMIVQTATRVQKSRREPSTIAEALLDAALTFEDRAPEPVPAKPTRRTRAKAASAMRAMAPKAAKP